MFRGLIQRPIAVTMTIIAVCIVSLVSLSKMPVSLMPDVDVPTLTVNMVWNGASAEEIDKTIVQPLRSQLLQLTDLTDIRCEAKRGIGTIHMSFNLKSDIDAQFMNVNERIDRVYPNFPSEITRPNVVKSSVTDIPAFFINLTISDSSDVSFGELSDFTTEVMVKRLEQIPEVAMVDCSGAQDTEIEICADSEKLNALRLSPTVLENAVTSSDIRLGDLTVKDGEYSWNIRFDSEIKNIEDIENINLNIGGRVFRFTELASIRSVPSNHSSIIKSDGKQAISMAVIKRSDARMSDLKHQVDATLTEISKEYGDEIEICIDRDQTELLDYSINNLKQNIIIGAILGVIVLLIFIGNPISPVLVGVSIPVSLLMSFLLMHLAGIDFNIISLSGLALGIGMMVDNTIIVVDNITQYLAKGMQMKEAAVNATREVAAPLLSSMLTTCAVFVPLIMLNGLAGVLFADQAIAVTVTLISSYLVAIIAIPLYYALLSEGRIGINIKSGKNTERINYRRLYQKIMCWVFRHQTAAWIIFFSMAVLGTVLIFVLPKEKFPEINHENFEATIDWNAPVSSEENELRTSSVINNIREITHWDALIGHQDFILDHSDNLDDNQTKLYIEVASQDRINSVQNALKTQLRNLYPEAAIGFQESTNVLNTILGDTGNDLILNIQSRDGHLFDPDEVSSLIMRFNGISSYINTDCVPMEENLIYTPDHEKMALYDVSISTMQDAISRSSNNRSFFRINSGNSNIDVRMSNINAGDPLVGTVKNTRGVDIPLSELVTETYSREVKEILSGLHGYYIPIRIAGLSNRQIQSVTEEVSLEMKHDGDYSVTFGGSYFSSLSTIHEMAFILLISLLLLYFILAAQFESLVQPFIILLEVIVDIFGALLALLIGRSSLNVMSLIGIVVMSGIVINDSILKVDTINKLNTDGNLLLAIFKGGSRRLNSILMTSITTILSIAPFLVKGSIGADLQYPFALAIIGGLTLGTLISLFFIPLLYYTIYRRQQ